MLGTQINSMKHFGRKNLCRGLTFVGVAVMATGAIAADWIPVVASPNELILVDRTQTESLNGTVRGRILRSVTEQRFANDDAYAKEVTTYLVSIECDNRQMRVVEAGPSATKFQGYHDPMADVTSKQVGRASAYSAVADYLCAVPSMASAAAVKKY